MKPENLTPTPVSDGDAAEHLKEILSSYELPESYQRLINGPWRLVAESIFEHYGEDSDSWGRMTWFTRILCTAIETSLQRQNPESVNDALNGFNIWLNSMREDGDFHSRCLNAANYAQRRISSQIAEDTEGGEAVVADDVSSVLPVEAELEDIEEVEEVIEIEEETDMTETTGDTEAQPSSLDSLTLSLAYSDSKPVTDHSFPEATDSPSETEERGHDMDISSPAAVEENTANSSENSGVAMDSLSLGSSITEPSAIAPVPMGTWLAFHDQDMPTLARLTIYDPASDSFMLANKNGILVRQIKKKELLNLVNGGLVQMVEFRSIAQ